VDPSAKDAFRQRLADLIADQNHVDDNTPEWWAGGRSAGGAPETVDPEAAARAEALIDVPQRPHSLSPDEFVPVAPSTCEESGLTESEIEGLMLKCLLNSGASSGREMCDQVRLPFRVVERVLRRMKENMLLVYKSSALLSDYVYELTDPGYDRARRASERCSYFGTAPVSLAAYVASVKAQSVTRQNPRLDDLRKAFSDLVMGEEVLNEIGQAVNSGLGLFLYGAPGNGKTSIAERIVKAFGASIWMPRAISVFGEVIRLFDPSHHTLLEEDPADKPWLDRRWIRVQRPTIVVGGELTLESLEISTSPATGISEAPLQMKANCGTLVIDDFGRQRVSAAELLNRWIVPLEKRYDYLNLINGRKIQVPFDQLIVFSTNLDPRQLVDEAFLRRIPYKIDVRDPTEAEFRGLFRRLTQQWGMVDRDGGLDYLIEHYYKAAERPMRFCHPRDLLRQVVIFCTFNNRPLTLSREAIDVAVRNYFAMI